MTEEAEIWQKHVDLMTEEERKEALKAISAKMIRLRKSFMNIITLELLYKNLLLRTITGEEFCERRDSIMSGDTG